jgi:hypothetical protein
MSAETNVAKLLDRIDHEIPEEKWPVWPGGWKNDIEAALLDSVFSVRARYGGENTGVRAVIRNWRQFRGDGRDDLTALAAFVGKEQQLLAILRNRQKLGSGLTKGAAAAEAARALVNAKVRSSRDLHGTEEERRAWCSVRGLGDVTWSYVQMLLGVQGVKADVMVVRFVAAALDRPVSSREARELVLAAAERIKVDAIDLDHAIWSWQRQHRT